MRVDIQELKTAPRRAIVEEATRLGILDNRKAKSSSLPTPPTEN